ncbi:MAG: PKD domain-containing protein [Saprospiraceae bacterium]|uniref:PKD domain-containing protein n=1 Tax=Candidatus Opimibacter skivensis TaxID=2982028 RepID=A0A9D7SR92_9BACT|nr:PKD domain-containing protein [Candidatus Opimibacter skivensis]
MSNQLLLLKRRNSIFFLLCIFAILSAFVFFRLNDSLPKKSTTEPTGLLTCADLDTIESAKLAWADLITHHPYYTRPPSTEKQSDKAEKARQTDSPDLAFELDFMKTMDPALGAVPYERLFKANLDLQRELKQRAPISGVSWKERGPYNLGGRTRAMMFDPNDATKKKVWAGGVGGGLWYTNDITIANPVWNKVDDFWSNIAISCITYNPANTQEFYVGTGEGWYNGGAQEGGGIWKSSNGGSSWAVLGNTVPGAWNSSSDFHAVQKIVVKSNGNVFAATRGYFGDRGGIMRSTDGGANWSLVKDVFTGVGSLYDFACDIEVASSGDLYAAFGMNSEGKIFKSTNANNGNAGTWTDLSSSAGVTTATRRIELACAPSEANTVYAVATNGAASNDIQWIKKTIDGGTNWTICAIPPMPENAAVHFTRGQGWYDLILQVHPTNAAIVFVGGVDVHRSSNSGTAWTPLSSWTGALGLPYVHADQHAIAFRPTLPNELVFTNDGGVYYSLNAGNIAVTAAFDDQNAGYNVAQFYSCATRNENNSNYFLGGTQDNGTRQFRIPQAVTADVTGGDGAFSFVDQADGDIQLAASIYNNWYRSLDNGNTFSYVVSETTGFFTNPSDYDQTRKILYAASKKDTVLRVSGISGVPIPTSTNLLVSLGSSKASALKTSPYNDVLFVGTADGRVYKFTSPSTTPTVTRIDNGATPITTTGWVNSIDVGEDDNHLLVTYSNYGVISLWETSNGGATWFNKEGNLPDIPVRWAIYNPDNRNQVLAATEIGVYTTDNFAHNTVTAPVWGTSNTGLANTRCDMLRYRAADKMVVVGTHGRGMFTTDIFTAGPIADFTSDVTSVCGSSLTVHFFDASFKPGTTWAWDINNDGTTDYTTQNPIHTYNTAGTYSVKLTINNGLTSITKYNYINILATGPLPNTSCTFGPGSINNGNNAGIGIFRFAMGTIDKSTPHNDGEYHDYTCTNASPLDINTLTNVTLQTSYANAEGARLYIDYNNNGNLEDQGYALEFPANTEGTRTLSFTTPSVPTVVTHKNLRARIVSYYGDVPWTPCDVGQYGQAEDYTVYFNCSLLVTQTSGSDPGSINAAIACANPGDTIKISAALANQTILFGGSVVALNKNLTFIGLGANTNLTWSGATGYFNILGGTNIEFKDLTITAGANASTGAFFNSGNLKLNHATIHRGSGPGTAILLRNQPGSTATMINMTSVWN